ncbi:mandelate racemase/muconate lactonizing enzyme family protein [Nisaea nitritireducens]|uniref:mandelate racemase/muconate lactonizing enzyme family protein n=1 Tax=Nisaea nitritireducens TaxID=568392 RepID=UPI00186799D1|nr:mandelate racemase/muconate lactonizing enzyme family protein [Nisaea nitritireducens]
MRITRIQASVHRPRAAGEQENKATYAGTDGPVFVRCRVDTDDGNTGNGFTGRFLAAEVAHFLNHAVAEAVTGEDPLAPDLMAAIERRFNPRAMTGVVVSAFSALEIALTDIQAKADGKSIAALLGGKRSRVPVHVTCGLPHLDIEALQATTARAIKTGAAGVKIVIAAKDRHWQEDAERILAVREAIGPDADLIADANCGFDLATARNFAYAVSDARLTWLEEPLRDNDPRQLAELTGEIDCPVGAGQMEQSDYRFEQLIRQGGVSVIQPNAVFAGGFSKALDVLRLAARHNREVCPAGGWDFVNLHLMAGSLEHGAMEHHEGHESIIRCISGSATTPKDGYLTVPDAPGLGIEIDEKSLLKAKIYP